jgi:pyruvate/2-oxoglutarate dehydrogenase complex dihydrolipoamide acyltransferase (E2) component
LGGPIASHTLNITIGGVVQRPVQKQGAIELHDHICLTVSIDHDIVDGAPAARFVRRLTALIEHGEGIIE